MDTSRNTSVNNSAECMNHNRRVGRRLVESVVLMTLVTMPLCTRRVNASQSNNDVRKNYRGPPPPPPGDPRQYRRFADDPRENLPEDDAYPPISDPFDPAGEGGVFPPVTDEDFPRRQTPPSRRREDTFFSDDYIDRDLGDYRDDYPEPQTPGRRQPPPPPPPPSFDGRGDNWDRPPPETAQQYAPIHYNFPKEQKESKRRFGFLGRKKKQKLPPPSEDLQDEAWPYPKRNAPAQTEDDVPETFSFSSPPDTRNDEQVPPDNNGGGNDVPLYQSPRRDAVTRFRSTFNGRVLLALSSGLVGSLVGAFLGKSVFNRPGPLAGFFCSMFIFCNFLRNPYGEFVKALGMALILALQRTRYIRRSYPTWCHVKASLRAGDRRPFPPTVDVDSPWAYRPTRRSDPDFRMLYSLIAMAFVGSTCGGNLPLIPAWMGSLVGAGFFALSTTINSPRGDLTRTMGMRVVALCYEMLGINTELDIVRKGGVVTGKILDKLFILDRKHRIKDRMIAGLTFAYHQIYNQINKAQTEMQEEPVPGPGSRRGPARDTGRPSDRGGRRPLDSAGPGPEKRRSLPDERESDWRRPPPYEDEDRRPMR